MATLGHFEQMPVWQQARQLTKQIYHITRQGQFVKDFALRDQMRRATISVMSNIAEGYERNGNKEFLHFLTIAKGSVGEVRAQLYIAFDQGYIDTTTFDNLILQTTEISKMLSGFITYLNKTPYLGQRYKNLKSEV